METKESKVKKDIKETEDVKEETSSEICLKNYLNFTIENDSIPIEELVTDFDKKYKIPKYQRKLKWSLEQKSKLIESLFLNIPLPSIFLFQDGKSFNIIDGQQRLESINSYITNNLKLTDLNILKELNNKLYKELNSEMVFFLKSKKINIIKISINGNNKSCDFDMENLIFERLNTGGISLTPTEIRNARYCDSDFHKVINKIEEKILYSNKIDKKTGKETNSITLEGKTLKLNGCLEDIVASYFSMLDYEKIDELDKVYFNNKKLQNGKVLEMTNKFISALNTIPLKYLESKGTLLLIKLDVYLFLYTKLNEEKRKELLNNIQTYNTYFLTKSNTLEKRSSSKVMEIIRKIKEDLKVSDENA